MTNISTLMPPAIEAMNLAKQIVAEQRPSVVTAKGDRDMVSDIDVAIERAVRAYLRERTPEVGFLGEEEGDTRGGHDLVWVLDPIDGTANFVQGIPLFAMSLALIRGTRPVLGVIDMPAFSSRYSAIIGQGAYHGSHRLKARPSSRLLDAVVTVGDYAVGQQAAEQNKLRLAVTGQLAAKALRVRMLGSAAVDLAWLAHGKTDAAIIFGNKPWDTAAGVIVAREAGASVVDRDGSEHSINSVSTIAASPALLDETLDLINHAQRKERS